MKVSISPQPDEGKVEKRLLANAAVLINSVPPLICIIVPSLNPSQPASSRDTSHNNAAADQMIENCVGVLGLPLGLAPNFVINGHSYVVPMAVDRQMVRKHPLNS